MLATIQDVAGLTQQGHFRKRIECPACASREQLAVLVRLPYSSGQIFDWVSTYYAKKGMFEAGYLEGASYTLLECRKCTLLFQQFVPDKNFLQRLYGVWVNPEAAIARDRQGTRAHKLIHYLSELWLLQYWGKGRQLKILDYGMGHGRWCETAATFGHDVHGYEFEDHRQEDAGRRGVFRTLSYGAIAGGEFDFINTEQVFEHLADPMPTLQHLLRGLKPGGLIRLSVPHGRNTKANLLRNEKLDFNKRIAGGLDPVKPLEHLNCFTHAALRSFGIRAGLQPFQFSLPQVIASRQDWRLPRKFLYNLLQPVYARLRFKDGCSIYFQKPGPARSI